MRHIIPVDLSTFPEGFHSRRLIGPKTESGIESCTVICSRVPPGCGGPSLHTHKVDQFYFVISGTIEMQLGMDFFTLRPNTLVHIPAGTPHCNWNVSDADELHLEICAPAPSGEERNVQPAFPRKVDNAQQLVREIDLSKFAPSRMSRGSSHQYLAKRSMGSNHIRVVASKIDPDATGPNMHIHEFDQFYFVLEGTLTVQVGLKRYEAGPNTLVVLPAGTIHSNQNLSGEVERHITFLVPEPADGGRSDHPMAFIERADHSSPAKEKV